MLIRLKKTSLMIVTLIFIYSVATSAMTAHATVIKITPAKPFQGDPIMITVRDASTTDISLGVIAVSKISFFTYHDVATALYGIDLHQKVGTTTLRIIFKDGSTATTSFFISRRPVAQESLPIPQQLGGNSTTNQEKIFSILTKENASLITMAGHANVPLWSATGTDVFDFPVASTTKSPRIVTDTYGIIRDSGAISIAHKGVDFQAVPGTPVYAINDGIVLATKTYIVYGNSVIIDHGLGLVSMYMHLSKMSVSPGESVHKGELIGYSGETGYSEGPHLHLTIRIGGVSIDPIAFFKLF